MADIRITCVTKTAPRHEAITGIGNGTQWWTEQQAITRIESKADTFHTMVNNKRADVLVVNGPTKKYLRTHADGVPNDNLLALPACPGH